MTSGRARLLPPHHHHPAFTTTGERMVMRDVWIMFVVIRYILQRAGSTHVTSCQRMVAADWSAGRARFDKRMSGVAARGLGTETWYDSCKLHQRWKRPNVALRGFPHGAVTLWAFTAQLWVSSPARRSARARERSNFWGRQVKLKLH